ncbi:MAG: hypothetical protein GF387_01405 [Candidatus Portnoybacteria bacterium]|nr:hypothetical protein [Candidatus Portnoybacteria bacterium]
MKFKKGQRITREEIRKLSSKSPEIKIVSSDSKRVVVRQVNSREKRFFYVENNKIAEVVEIPVMT